MKIQIIITSFLLICGIMLKAQDFKSPDTNNRNKPTIKKSNVVSCSEKRYKIKGRPDPIFVKTCLFKSFKFVNTGSPDYTGKYSWEYNLYKKQNGKYIKASNSELFNQNQNKLLSIINQKILKDYLKFSSDPETKWCFEGMKPPKFTIDQLRIEFMKNEVYFWAEFGLYGACRNVDGTLVSFTLNEIYQYLKE